MINRRLLFGCDCISSGLPESQSLTNFQEQVPGQLTIEPYQENDVQTLNRAAEEERFSSERTGNEICFNLKYLFCLSIVNSFMVCNERPNAINMIALFNKYFSTLLIDECVFTLRITQVP